MQSPRTPSTSASTTTALESGPLNRKVYVGNLPEDVTEYDLRCNFEEVCRDFVEEVKIRRRRKEAVHAFVSFHDPQSVPIAVKQLHEGMFRGNIIVVEEAHVHTLTAVRPLRKISQASSIAQEGSERGRSPRHSNLPLKPSLSRSPSPLDRLNYDYKSRPSPRRSEHHSSFRFYSHQRDAEPTTDEILWSGGSRAYLRSPSPEPERSFPKIAPMRARRRERKGRAGQYYDPSAGRRRRSESPSRHDRSRDYVPYDLRH